MMSDHKRYDQFPQLAAMARDMSHEGLALVTAWHRVLTQGLAAFVQGFGKEARAQHWEPQEALAAVEALRLWLGVMQDVAGVLVDRRPADWCCKKGMMAAPDPCPQHGAPVAGSVRHGPAGAEVWLHATDMTPAGWYAIGTLRETHSGWAPGAKP